MTLSVRWEPVPWYSRYHKGMITGGDVQDFDRIESIWKRASTGQVRLYSAHDFDGKQLLINDQPFVIMRARGRFGRLYIQQ